MTNARKDALPAPLLRRALDDHGIAEAFQGFDRPLPLAYLLFRVPVIIPRLLITAPRSKEVIDDHKYFVGDSQRRLLLAEPYFETPKGAAQESRRFPGAPGTWHQDPAEIAIPLTRFAAVRFTALSWFPGQTPAHDALLQKPLHPLIDKAPADPDCLRNGGDRHAVR